MSVQGEYPTLVVNCDLSEINYAEWVTQNCRPPNLRETFTNSTLIFVVTKNLLVTEQSIHGKVSTH